MTHLLSAISIFLSVHVAQAQEIYKANLVDRAGNSYGTRQIRDLKLCGTSAGPAWVLEGADHPPKNPGNLKEAKYREFLQTQAPEMYFSCTTQKNNRPWNAKDWPGSEIKTLMGQGDPKNRIDLTIVGDGYTQSEKTKFFSDAEKITKDLFGAETFKTYLALFNVHAVFVPSAVSGIGDGRPKNTALGLYRDSTLRQAVMPGNSSAARKAAALAPDSDYAILVGNDRFYGGLGGAFAITTSAPLNITTVLRHELGHNFGRVGEEYDGGQVYSGANFSRSAQVPWQHFVSGGGVKVHEAVQLNYAAPWKNLSAGPYEVKVNMPAGMDRMYIDFNSLGFDTPKDAALTVDGKLIPFTGDFNYDRNFYRVELDKVPSGWHTVAVTEVAKDGNNVLSKLGVYALPASYPKGADSIGAYTVYNDSGTKTGYRPTESTCLMRDMKSRKFCEVCVENMWRNFLKEVNLIDGVSQSAGNVVLDLIPVEKAKLLIQWTGPKGSRPDLNNKTEWTMGAGDSGRWTVRVKFVSPEVKDPKADQWAIHQRQVDL